MRESAPYKNKNYTWFASRYGSYLYVDRIVVSKDFAGMKVGSSLYADLMAEARAIGVERVVCEYNIDPPNMNVQLIKTKIT